MNDLLSKQDAEAVIQILIRELDVAANQVTSGARLDEDLGADSLTKVEINMALEDQFDLSIPDEQAERIQTVGDLVEVLAELLQARRH